MRKLEIKYLPVEKIKPREDNPRVHSDEQIEQLKKSITEFGMCTPIGIHLNTIVYGHARFRALCELGWTEVPTVNLSHLKEAERAAYVIADNKIALNSAWDDEKLHIEMEKIYKAGVDLDLTGFTAVGELEEGEYLPELNPTSYENDLATPESVQKAQENIDGRYESASEQVLADLICPECGHEFQIDKDEIK